MATYVQYQRAPGAHANDTQGVLTIDATRTFDVEAALTAGAGTITINARDRVLVARLDSYWPLRRIGTTTTGARASFPEPVSVTLTDPVVGQVLTLDGSGNWVNGAAPDRLRSVYIPTDECLLNYRKAIVRARHGGRAARVLARGDSTTLGVLSGTNPNTELRKDFTWTSRAKAYLQAGNMLPGQVEDSWMNMNTADDARFTYGGGATGPTLGPSQTLTFADGAGHDAYDLCLLRASGASASVVVTGTEVVGSPLTLDLTVAPWSVTPFVGTIRVPMSSAIAHTFTITGPAAGTVQILNVEPLTVATPPIVKVGGYGVSGQTFATLNPAATGSGTNMAAILRPLPDLQFLLMGINDMRNSADLAAGAATYKTNLGLFVAAFQAQGADVALITAPSYLSNQSGVPSQTESVLFHQAIYEIADQYSCAVLDLQRRWGYGVTSTTGASTTPVTNSAMYDGTHPTLYGYRDLGRMVARFLADAAA